MTAKTAWDQLLTEVTGFPKMGLSLTLQNSNKDTQKLHLTCLAPFPTAVSNQGFPCAPTSSWDHHDLPSKSLLPGLWDWFDCGHILVLES